MKRGKEDMVQIEVRFEGCFYNLNIKEIKDKILLVGFVDKLV